MPDVNLEFTYNDINKILGKSDSYLPESGTPGQSLTKTAEAAGWQNPNKRFQSRIAALSSPWNKLASINLPNTGSAALSIEGYSSSGKPQFKYYCNVILSSGVVSPNSDLGTLLHADSITSDQVVLAHSTSTPFIFELWLKATAVGVFTIDVISENNSWTFYDDPTGTGNQVAPTPGYIQNVAVFPANYVPATTVNGQILSTRDNKAVWSNPNRRFGLLGKSTNSTNPWFKAASIEAPNTAGWNANLVLHVYESHMITVTPSTPIVQGVVHIAVRVGATAGKVDRVQAYWEYSNGFSEQRCIVAFTNPTSSGPDVIEVWFNNLWGNGSLVFDVISESPSWISTPGSGHVPSMWTLYNRAEGVAEPTPGFNRVVSFAPEFQESVTTQLADMGSNLVNINADLLVLDEKISANSGVGGFVSPYDFGASPTQEAITAYVKTQVWPGEEDQHQDTEIFNGTSVVNLYDNTEWKLANTPLTNPPVFEWINIGSPAVSQATTETAGVWKASTANLDLNIRSNGTGYVNGLQDALNGKQPAATPDITQPLLTAPTTAGGAFGTIPQSTFAVSYSEFTLLASGWLGAEAPYSQTVTVPRTAANGFMSLAQGQGPEVADAESYANIRLQAQTATSLSFIADGEKPEVDIKMGMTLIGV